MENNKKKMLDSILERERKSITIERLIVKKDKIDNIRALNKGKAGGLSKITYDIMKECNGKIKEILRKFSNECIKTKLMPIDWSRGVIYPIPKPGDWNLNLDKTRPITLLECPRKLLMKILTNRLTKI